MPIVKKQQSGQSLSANGPAKQPAAAKQPAGGTYTTKSTARSAWDLTAGIKMLCYGQSGSGKTTFAATFPGKILWLVCSGGSRPGELRSIDTPEYHKKIDARIIDRIEQVAELLIDAPAFETVVLDHASGLSDLILKEILGLEELPAQKAWGLASQQQYGQLALMCKESFRALLNLPQNVVILSQERTFGDESGGSEIIRPTVGAALTPSVTGWLNPACDFVVQMYKKPVMIETVQQIGKSSVTTQSRGQGIEYCLRCEPHDIFTTKFRVPRGRVIPSIIVDPTYDKVLAVIEGREDA